MTRIFLTGASGYLGGEVLFQLKNSALSNSTVACLNRDSKKADVILKAYPDVEIVKGDLDSADVIKKEAEKADIVLHLASTKHVPSTEAIIAGLSSSTRSAGKLGTWIQMSGASLFVGKEVADGRFGEASDKTYGDVSNASEVISIMQTSPSRVVDQLAIAQDASKMRTALIIGPLIYGVGRGPCQPRSIQVPEIARVTLELGHGVKLLKGESAWSNVHVADVGQLILLLVEAAIEGKNVGWNTEGIYHPENGVMKFGDISEMVAEEAIKQGVIEGKEVEEIDAAKADTLSAHASVLWGTNAIISGQRARQSLNWRPEGHSLQDDVAEVVRREAEAARKSFAGI